MYPYKVVSEGVVEVSCHVCEQVLSVDIGVEGLKRLEEGDMLIQKAIPHVPKELRELLISGICPECFTKMYGMYD